MLAKRFPLALRYDGELDVWVQLCVLLAKPMASSNGSPVVGYYRNIGIRVPGPLPKSFLERLVPDGAIDWEETEVNEVEPSSLDQELRNCITVPDAEGVWYRSGHIYFSEENSAGAV